MQTNSRKQIIAFTITITTLLLIEMAQSQRPFFAGSRPLGQNQKDKYNVNNNVNSNNNNAGITNRFGAADEPTPLPHGATQKPPAHFIPVVYPESNYLPIATAGRKPAIANRFGESDESANKNVNSLDSNADKPGASKGGAAAGGVAAAAVAGANERLPIDAKGDKELVDILNRMPVEQRPFWFINAAAIEAQRNGTFRNFAGVSDSRGSFFG